MRLFVLAGTGVIGLQLAVGGVVALAVQECA
jgi:hypothetical protein